LRYGGRKLQNNISYRLLTGLRKNLSAT